MELVRHAVAGGVWLREKGPCGSEGDALARGRPTRSGWAFSGAAREHASMADTERRHGMVRRSESGSEDGLGGGRMGLGGGGGAGRGGSHRIR